VNELGLIPGEQGKCPHAHFCTTGVVCMFILIALSCL
jgi:hypothetical protein